MFVSIDTVSEASRVHAFVGGHTYKEIEHVHVGDQP